MKKIEKIIKEHSKPNHFVLLRAGDVSALLFEGKTVMAASLYDFHAGREDAYFNRKKINKHWDNPESLLRHCKKMLVKSSDEIVDLDEPLFDF